MAAINEHTGDQLTTKTTTEDYRSGWDRIFGKKTEDKPVPVFCEAEIKHNDNSGK